MSLSQSNGHFSIGTSEQVHVGHRLPSNLKPYLQVVLHLINAFDLQCGGYFK